MGPGDQSAHRPLFTDEPVSGAGACIRQPVVRLRPLYYAKSNQITPDPGGVLLSEVVTILDDGKVAATEPEGQRLIAQLRLNSSEMIHFRRLWLEIVAMAEGGNPRLYQRLREFPNDLPDLRTLHPPEGNDRPEGIEQPVSGATRTGTTPRFVLSQGYSAAKRRNHLCVHDELRNLRFPAFWRSWYALTPF